MADTFTLKDRNGDEHEYIVMPHPATEGMALSAEVLGLLTPTLLSALGGALESDDLRTAVLGALGPGNGVSDRKKGVSDLLKMASGVDWSKVGDDVGSMFRSPRFVPLMRQLLKYTSRGDSNGMRSLSNEADFEIAFAANYMEAYQAAWRVCVVNGFFPDLSGFQRFGAATLGQPASGTQPMSASVDAPAASG